MECSNLSYQGNRRVFSGLSVHSILSSKQSLILLVTFSSLRYIKGTGIYKFRYNKENKLCHLVI